MKTLKYSFGLLLSFLAIASFNSCSEEEAEYTPAAAPAGEQVYFSSSNSAQIDITQETKTFDVAVGRSVAGAAVSVPVTVTADSLANTIFDFPATVEFADSAKTANYTVSVKEGVVPEFDVYYNVSIAIDEAMTTPYGIGTYEFTVGVPAPWSEWEQVGTGTYTLTGYWGGTHSGLPIYYREYQLNNEDAQFYIPGIANSMDLTIDLNRQTGICTVLPQKAADNANYGQVTVTDIPNYPFTNVNPDDFAPSYYDKEKGLITLNLAYVVCTLWGANTNGSFGTCTETFQFDGFKQYDYTFSMDFKGHYVENDGTDNAIISATKGVDIPQFLMTVIAEDEDAQATVNGMLDGTVPCDTLTESGYYAYPLTESGNYTAIAITFDAEGNPNEVFTKEFEFYVAGQENPWVSLGMATYTDDIMTPFMEEPENYTYKVEVRENKDVPGLIRVINPFAPFGADTSKEYYIEIDATDPEGVWIEGTWEVGLDIGVGPMSITSMAWYQANAQGATKEDAKGAGLCGILADGVITFPVDGLLSVMGGKTYYGNRNGAFKLDMSNMEPVEAAAAKASAVRSNISLEINEDAATGFKCGIRAKKIDNSFMTPVNAELK